MVDETAEGNGFAVLRMREADLDKHLASGQGAESKDPAREKARDEARKRPRKKPRSRRQNRKVPEFGSDKDFQLVQALNQLKGRPVLVSKTQVVERQGPRRRKTAIAATAIGTTPGAERPCFVMPSAQCA